MAAFSDSFAWREMEENCAEIVGLFLELYAEWQEILKFSETDGSELVDRLTVFVHQDLLELKEKCDLLYREERTRKPDVNAAEVLFDYLVGAIYHHLMKLREIAFQIHSRIPPVQSSCSGIEKTLLETWQRLVKRARAEFEEGKEVAGEFWTEALEVLRRLIFCYRDSPSVMRALVMREAAVQQSYPEVGLLGLLREALDNEPERGFIMVIDELVRCGWFEQAVKVLKRALQLLPSNEELARRAEQLKAAAP